MFKFACYFQAKKLESIFIICPKNGTLVNSLCKLHEVSHVKHLLIKHCLKNWNTLESFMHTLLA